MRFVIPGKVISDSRPRVGKNGVFYNPKAFEKKVLQSRLMKMMRDWKGSEDNEISKEASNLPCMDFYKVGLDFGIQIPSSDSKAVRNAKLDGSIACTNFPDLDNAEKFYLDAFTGIFFDNDKKVTSLRSQKYYSETEEVTVEITGGKNGFQKRTKLFE